MLNNNTASIKHSRFWETNSSTASRESSRIPEPVEFSPHLPCDSSSSISILSSHLRLGLPRCLFPSNITIKTLYALLFSPTHATCPSHLMLLAVIWQEVQTIKLHIVQLSQISFCWKSRTFRHMMPHRTVNSSQRLGNRYSGSKEKHGRSPKTT